MSKLDKLIRKKRACEDLYRKTGRKIYLREARAYEDLIARERGRDGGGGGCFLTTACVNYYGQADDGVLLETLRDFRDRVVLDQLGGAALVARYYAVAPLIVQRIERSGNAPAEYRQIFIMITSACSAIQCGNHNHARSLYITEVERLIRQYPSVVVGS